MRRADRLFQIVQLLRGQSLVTAAWLAQELEVSERTVYRDVRDLVSCGVPIEGEAGVGYQLARGFDLPPLMFTESELEALALGASMVRAFADESLARQATSALSKIAAALPAHLRDVLEREGVGVADCAGWGARSPVLEDLRRAIRNQRKVHFTYERADGAVTQRGLRPLGLYFWGRRWTCTGWCELRDDFRTFRVDRMSEFQLLDEVFEEEPGRTLAAFLRLVAQSHREAAEQDP